MTQEEFEAEVEAAWQEFKVERKLPETVSGRVWKLGYCRGVREGSREAIEANTKLIAEIEAHRQTLKQNVALIEQLIFVLKGGHKMTAN